MRRGVWEHFAYTVTGKGDVSSRGTKVASRAFRFLCVSTIIRP
jgi:hypothetical protein